MCVCGGGGGFVSARVEDLQKVTKDVLQKLILYPRKKN